MAVSKEISTTALAIEVESGVDSKGNTTYSKKSFSGVKDGADPEKVYAVADAYDPQGKGNFPAYLNYWTPENPSNDFPRPAQTNFYNYLGYESLNYIDGSYWKIKTVSLGYTFPKSLTSKLGVSKLRAYVTANNLFSFAKNHLIQDYDAERGGSAKAPLQRQFIFGLNLDF